MFGFGGKNDKVEIKVGSIRIRVRPLDLGIDASKLTRERERAVDEKTADDLRAYGKSTADLRTMAESAGYYASTAHNAWAMAAAARVGDVFPADWWQRFDPFGGTAGNGPEVLPEGKYPGILSRIAMAHDTDWSLGRHFGAGPMKNLRGSNLPPKVLGLVGLAGEANILVGMYPHETYTTGHRDWDVHYE